MKKYSVFKFLVLFLLFSFSPFHLACAPQTLAPQREAGSPSQAPRDRLAIESLARELMALPENPKAKGAAPEVVEHEAHLIAKLLVDQTRETNKEFRMTRGPIWSNFLIKIGKREKGYCYHWVPELLRALPPIPLQAFERHWGGSFLSLGRENNAVIITRRAAGLATGIVYDAWRGVGRPFWKKISEDKKYRWEQRFNESQILIGEAKVEGK